MKHRQLHLQFSDTEPATVNSLHPVEPIISENGEKLALEDEHKRDVYTAGVLVALFIMIFI